MSRQIFSFVNLSERIRDAKLRRTTERSSLHGNHALAMERQDSQILVRPYSRLTTHTNGS